MFDGNRQAIAAYLAYIMRRFGAPENLTAGSEFEELIDAYAVPGRFTATIRYYRARGPRRPAEAASSPDPLSTPATILWGESDRIMRVEWSDRSAQWFNNFTLRRLPGIGHFVPQQAPDALAAAIRQAATS
jgi:pimeloyl-ACP methyl ester carboxylesterase